MTRPVTSTPIATTVVQHDDELPRGRASWGAILAGAVAALITMLVLEVFMLWLGLSAIDPAVERNPFDGLATGAAIGYLITLAISLFVGGLVAGRLANRVNGADVFLHGMLTWGVVTLVGLWLAATTIGALIGGTLGVVGQAAGAVGSGLSAVAPEISTQIEDLIDENQALIDDVQEEVSELWTDPAARSEFRTVVTRIFRDGDPTVADADRQELVDVLATNTDLSEAEAQATVDEWIAVYEDAQMQLAQAEEALREAGEQAADALAGASMWAFFGLLAGLLVTWLGTRAGAPSSTSATRRS